jgi:hypothetical protein
MGIAVLREGDLADWKVRSLKGKWSKDKLAHIIGVISKHCRYHNVTDIAIKIPDPTRSSRQLDALTRQLLLSAKEKRLPHTIYSLYDLHAFTRKETKRKKQDIAEYVLERYPQVKQEYFKERNNKQEYYSKMFEAVLCAHMSDKLANEMQ